MQVYAVSLPMLPGLLMCGVVCIGMMRNTYRAERILCDLCYRCKYEIIDPGALCPECGQHDPLTPAFLTARSASPSPSPPAQSPRR